MLGGACKSHMEKTNKRGRNAELIYLLSKGVKERREVQNGIT